ncbi:hypothetical protein G6F23_014854 [Rhizopus arrhizus]|nr:hypothetical protein G6F23_014854 [Rhizopus arrhizus]
MKLAFADVYAHVADARHMRMTPEQMLRPDYLAERARMIDPNVAQAFASGHAPQGGTVYLTAADKSGMMVSFIQIAGIASAPNPTIPMWSRAASAPSTPSSLVS